MTGEQAQAPIRLTWWGHATLLVEDRVRCLTDPVLTPRLLHLHRRAGMTPRPPEDLDAVLISHLHADHLHLPSLSQLPDGTTVLIPRGAAVLLRGLRLRVVEVVAGDVVPLEGGEVHVVRAVHDATRWPFGRVRGEAVGYVVCGAGATYFAGDTIAFDEMAQLHPRLDVALLPVGGWGPWLRGQHLDPRQAARCLPVLGARTTIPIHYGTLWPWGFDWLRPSVFHTPGEAFSEEAGRVVPDVDVRVLSPGTSTTVWTRPAGGSSSGGSIPEEAAADRSTPEDSSRESRQP